MNLVDTHCHLNMPPLSDDTDGVLARAFARDVTRVVVPAYDEASWPEVEGVAARPQVFAAFGLHPWAVAQVPPGGPLIEFENRLAAQLADHPAVAVGEIGLDTKIEECGLAEQLPVLETQLALAVAADLPVILHCRGAFEELLSAVNRHGGKLRGVLCLFKSDALVGFCDLGVTFAVGLTAHGEIHTNLGALTGKVGP